MSLKKWVLIIMIQKHAEGAKLRLDGSLHPLRRTKPPQSQWREDTSIVRERKEDKS